MLHIYSAFGPDTHRRFVRRVATSTFALICSAGIIASTHDARAQGISDEELKELRRVILEQRRQIDTQGEILTRQQNRLEYLEERLNRLSRPVVQPARYPAVPNGTYNPREERRQRHREAADAPAPPAVAQQQQESPPSPTDDIVTDAIRERAGAGVFGKKGEFGIEPSFEYTHNQQNRVTIQGFTVIPAITVGSIDIREVTRDTVTAAITGRYNFTDRFQMDLKVPFVYREDTTLTRPIGTGASSDREFTAEGSGLGDIEVGAHYQITDGTSWLPILVGNLRVKSRTGKDPFEIDIVDGGDFDGLEAELPTGSGFWAVEPGITALIPSDPVVFYTNLAYQWNIERTVTSANINNGASTEIDPGDAIKFGFGFGFGINERASFSLGYDHAFVLTSKQGGQDISNSELQVGTFSAGVAYRLSEQTNLNLTVGMGVTDPAPDVQLMLRIPFRFGT